MAYSSFGDPRLGEIYAYWLAKGRDGTPPRRADIRPSELGSLVRHINLIDVIRAPDQALRFRHRLVGTGISEWLGIDPTGKMVDESLYGEPAAEIRATLSRIVVSAQAHHRLARVDWHARKFAVMESVEMPLAGDDGAVAMILRGAVYRNAVPGDAEPFFKAIPGGQ